MAIAINVVVSVVVVIIVVCCAVCLVKRKKRQANRAASVEIPVSTASTSGSRSTQPGVVQESHQPEGTPVSSLCFILEKPATP